MQNQIREAVRNLEYPEYAREPEKPLQPEHDFSLSANPFALSRGERGYRFSLDPALLQAISSREGISAEMIAITAGCDGAIRAAADLFIDPEDRVIIPVPSFGRYEFHAKLRGAAVIFLPSPAYPWSIDIPACIQGLERASRHGIPKLIFIGNPNNPTGELLQLQAVEDLVRAAEKTGTAVFVDEALIDYCKPGHSAVTLIERYRNLMVARSFSKLFALAGMRIGYIAASPALMYHLRAIISPFETASPALEAATEALKDEKHIEKSRRAVKEGLAYLRQNLPEGMSMSNSSSLVSLLSGSSSPGTLYKTLKAQSIHVTDGRSFRGIEHDDTVRICIKTPEKLKPLIDALG
jgi:histidinol-phosphate aminotransferase